MSDNALERRRQLPAIPTAESFAELLGRYMWVTAVHLDYHWMGTLRVEGMLKPDYSAKDAGALRRSFLNSLDAVIAIMDAAGARWESHPEIRMTGMAQHFSDGHHEFGGLQCEAELRFFPS